MGNAAVSRLRAVTVIWLLSIGLSGCFAAAGPSGPPDNVRLPTSSWRSGDPAMLALGEGVLNGSARDGCVWLEHGSAHGSSGAPHRTPVLWPDGYVARFDPLEILDESGTVVAKGGDHLQFGGGLVPVRDDACMLGAKEVFAIQSGLTVLRR